MSDIKDELKRIITNAMKNYNVDEVLAEEADKDWDNLYSKMSTAATNHRPLTVFTVSMCLVEMVLDQASDEAPETLEYLTDLIRTLADRYHEAPNVPVEPSRDAADACVKVWGMTRDQALEWLGSDTGVFIMMGEEMRWMSGAEVMSVIDKVKRGAI